jgi:hypothetical protein
MCASAFRKSTGNSKSVQYALLHALEILRRHLGMKVSPPSSLTVSCRAEQVQPVKADRRQHVGFGPPYALCKRRWEWLQKLNAALIGYVPQWRRAAERDDRAEPVAVRQARGHHHGRPSLHHFRWTETGAVVAQHHCAGSDSVLDWHLAIVARQRPERYMDWPGSRKASRPG